MAATRRRLPTELPQRFDRSAVLPLHLPAPARHRPRDAAHVHWPEDNFHTHRRDQAPEEHCPPEVYGQDERI